MPYSLPIAIRTSRVSRVHKQHFSMSQPLLLTSASSNSTMAPKRKAPASVGYTDSAGHSPNKRSAISKPEHPATTSITADIATRITNGAQERSGSPKFDHSRPEERYGIVQREFYPQEMSNERCAMYNNNEIPRPMAILNNTIAKTKAAREQIQVGECVVHWFKRDLRTFDNRGLGLAAKKAKEGGVPLVCMFLVSPQDYQAHCTSKARVNFDLRTLEVLKEDLAELDIPLYVETVEKRKTLPARFLALCEEWKAKHVCCNIEYEVDELRREVLLTKKCLEKGINFTAVHDDVVVAPGDLKTGTGKQYAVYSPWYRAWMAHVHAHPELLDASDPPTKNPPSARMKFKDIFDSKIPHAPENKRMDPEEQNRFEHLWPAGEHEAMERLEKFLKNRISRYKETRNVPAEDGTAKVSVHHSAGTLAARTSVRMARDANSTKKLDGGNPGIQTWISEVAWRDFYKHVLAHWPYIW